MKIQKSLFLSLVAGSLLIVSCQKGDAGAAGAAGAAGTAGATGATGAAGTDSILYSAPITLAMNPYDDTVNEWKGYIDSLAAPLLTQAVINKDLILGYVYVPYGSVVAKDSAWVSVDNQANQGMEIFSTTGLIVVEAWWTDFVTPNSGDGNLTGFKFKYFVVPPSVLASLSQLTTVPPVELSDYKRMSYAQAMTALGLRFSATGTIVNAKQIK
jgi:hypothetical protein